MEENGRRIIEDDNIVAKKKRKTQTVINTYFGYVDGERSVMRNAHVHKRAATMSIDVMTGVRVHKCADGVPTDAVHDQVNC